MRHFKIMFKKLKVFDFLLWTNFNTAKNAIRDTKGYILIYDNFNMPWHA